MITSISKSIVQANEITYELHTLGWKAFQNLCQTILGEIWGQTIQGFCDSKDGGRDGAFYGTWNSKEGELLQGSFTVQCKFTATANKHLNLSDLKDELDNAKRLVSRGLADHYFLFTNNRLTGSTDEIIKKAFENIGVKSFLVHGCESISRMIRESSRLRMLVPRIYGLGDLTQIMDQRAYDQAKEIISTIRDDLAKFIITESYKKSAEALVSHGFVLLLGEPACGKSTIAATLAVVALDTWKCPLIKVRDADDFVAHFNPHEKQFFWIDDAFGATQFDSTSAHAWNKAFTHINTAIRLGSRIVFTSRTYIYKAAKRHLKASALPVINESQVVIEVEDLTKNEREQILYNHIKLGNQSQEFKKRIKNFLPKVAEHNKFSPEIARRLGNSLFTKSLNISADGLNDFLENPVEYLYEIISTLDNGCQAALALIFMRGGILPSPVEINIEEDQPVLQRLGSSQSQMLEALGCLNGSLLLDVLDGGRYIWKFKHPTVRDAFSELVSKNRELMGLYLIGSPVEKLFKEISCGDVGIEGVKIIVLPSQYETVMLRLKSFNIKGWQNKSKLYDFLSYRCNREFLQLYIDKNPSFIQDLQVYSYLCAVPEVDVLLRLHQFCLLPEQKRLESIKEIKSLAFETPDAGFLEEKFQKFITQEELKEILDFVRMGLLPDLKCCLDGWERNCPYNSEDVEDYYNDLKDSLNAYKVEFKEDKIATEKIDNALLKIDFLIEELQPEREENSDENVFSYGKYKNEDPPFLRSIFEDVDM